MIVALVTQLGLPGLVRHGLRHTALTWMADAGIDLHLLQRVAGHQDPAVTAGYLHPDTQALLAAWSAFSSWWSRTAPRRSRRPLLRASRSQTQKGPAGMRERTSDEFGGILGSVPAGG